MAYCYWRSNWPLGWRPAHIYNCALLKKIRFCGNTDVTIADKKCPTASCLVFPVWKILPCCLMRMVIARYTLHRFLVKVNIFINVHNNKNNVNIKSGWCCSTYRFFSVRMEEISVFLIIPRKRKVVVILILNIPYESFLLANVSQKPFFVISLGK